MAVSISKAQVLPRTTIGLYLLNQVGHPAAPLIQLVLQQLSVQVKAVQGVVDIRVARQLWRWLLVLAPVLVHCRHPELTKALGGSALALTKALPVGTIALLRSVWLVTCKAPRAMFQGLRSPLQTLANLHQWFSALPGRFVAALLQDQVVEKLELSSEGGGNVLELLSGPDGRVEGVMEMVVSGVLTVGASFLMQAKALKLGLLIARQNEPGMSRSAEWLAGVVQYPLFCIIHSIMTDSTGYLERRLALKWRRAITGKLHDLYFSQMRYYRITNDARSTSITDPDIRLCTDVKLVAKVLSNLILSLVKASVQLGTLGGLGFMYRHWSWSLVAPSTFVLAYGAIICLYPRDLHILQAYLGAIQGKLVQGLTRVQLHADRISQLQGESFEGAQLRDYTGKIHEAACKERIRNAYAQGFETTIFGTGYNVPVVAAVAFSVAACMGANDVRARVGAEAVPLSVVQPFKETATQIGVQMRDLHGFFNAVAGCGMFLTAKFATMGIQGTLLRIKEFYTNLLLLRTAVDVMPLLSLAGPIGGESSVNLMDHGFESVIVGGFSFMARLKMEAPHEEQAQIFNFSASKDIDCIMAYQHCIGTTTTKLGFSINHGSGPWSTVAVKDALVVGEEATFLFTVSSNGDMKIYKEGKLVGQNLQGQAPLYVQRPDLWVGACGEEGKKFVGSISNVKVWNQEVTWEGKPTSTFVDDGPVIAFEGVTVQTPTNHVLLKGLTFEVGQGQHLLICGHNGAGKSSIIRALCSLWPVTEGRIARPGGAVQAEENIQLHDELYYLPQKPCNVLGSLSDQLTYPLQCPGGLPEEELRRWLRYVDLEYLVDRMDNPDRGVSIASLSPVSTQDSDREAIDWEKLLSMGEQQALSIARLLYHRPRFAILDECTSAVGRGLERRLFEVARELGISCLTITHRPALKEHHERLLQLTGNLAGDGKGWQLEDLPPEKGQERPPMKPRCKDTAEVHARVGAYLEKQRARHVAADSKVENGDGEMTEHDLIVRRSKKYRVEATQRKQLLAADAVRRRWPTTLSRLLAVVKLGASTGPERRRAVFRVVKMCMAHGVRTYFYWQFFRAVTGGMQASFTGNMPMVLIQSSLGILMGALNSIVDQYYFLQSELLGQDLAAGVSNRLLGKLVQSSRFQKVMAAQSVGGAPVVESPVLRISEVNSLFQAVSAQINQSIIPIFNLFLYVPMVWQGIGAAAPVLLVVNFILFRGAQLLAPNFPEMEARTALLESRFQVLHSRLRSIAEAVAFSGGGAAERRLVEPRLTDCLEHAEGCNRQEVLYTMMLTLFTDYRQLPIWTHRIVSALYTQQNNPDSSAGMPASIIAANFLFDRSIEFPQVAVQRLVRLVEASGRIDGQCLRLLEVVAACNAVEGPENDQPAPTAALEVEGCPSPISVRDLDLVTARGVCLASKVCFKAEPGSPMLITGPNASGKSLLGSVLLGLWPTAGDGASVTMPGSEGPRPPLSAIMPAPQQIYLARGPLWAQLGYPAVLRLPSSPPFELQVSNLPSTVTDDALSAHFAEWQGSVSSERAEPVVVTFTTSDDLSKALAQPQDHVVNGEELQCDFVPGSDQPSLLRMRRCFRAVNIEHVLLREKEGWLTDKAWEDSLSGGEQQRLCLARVLYHKPVFGLLDECTSMVAADAEEALYQCLFRKWGITPITLTQRMFMPDLYAKELRLGLSSFDGWELASLESKPADAKHPA